MNKFIITLLLAFTLVACSENGHIPDTSIIDELSTDELSDALDYERTHKLYYGGFRKGFEDMYPMIRKYVNKMSEIEKARYAKLSYRELVNAQIAISDSIENKRMCEKWQEKYDAMLPQAKQIAKELGKEVHYGMMYYSYKNNEYGDAAFHRWARDNGYAQYFFPSAFLLDYDKHWNYVNIIKHKIDSDFDDEVLWVYKQMIKTIEDKYPLAYLFFLDRYQESVELYNKMERHLWNSGC